MLAGPALHPSGYQLLLRQALADSAAVPSTAAVLPTTRRTMGSLSTRVSLAGAAEPISPLPAYMAAVAFGYFSLSCLGIAAIRWRSEIER